MFPYYIFRLPCRQTLFKSDFCLASGAYVEDVWNFI